MSVIFVEDLHNVPIGRTVVQFKIVRSRGQDLTGYLNGLAESHLGGFVPFVGSDGVMKACKHECQTYRNKQRSNDSHKNASQFLDCWERR
jgi:hypothetical protein